MKRIILVLILVSANFAEAVELPLLGVALRPADLENLALLKDTKNAREMRTILAARYPQLVFESLDRNAENEGLYRRMFADPKDSRPILFLKEQATREVVYHEVLHFLIDLARMNKWPVETELRRVSYVNWRREVAAQTEMQLMQAMGDASSSATLVAKADYLNALLEGMLIIDFEEIEVTRFLVVNHALLGLTAQEVVGQMHYFAEKFASASKSLAEFYQANAKDFRPNPSLLQEKHAARIAEINTRLMRFAQRLNELSKIPEQLACELNVQ